MGLNFTVEGSNLLLEAWGFWFREWESSRVGALKDGVSFAGGELDAMDVRPLQQQLCY